MISNIRETIVGDVMDSINDAKRSAALIACIKLYEIEELDKNFMPKKLEDVLFNTI